MAAKRHARAGDIDAQGERSDAKARTRGALVITKLKEQLAEARSQIMLRGALHWYETAPCEFLVPTRDAPVMGYTIVTEVQQGRIKHRVTFMACTVDHYFMSDVDTEVLHWYRQARKKGGVGSWTGVHGDGSRTGTQAVHATEISAWYAIRAAMQADFAVQLLDCDKQIAHAVREPVHGV